MLLLVTETSFLLIMGCSIVGRFTLGILGCVRLVLLREVSNDVKKARRHKAKATMFGLKAKAEV